MAIVITNGTEYVVFNRFIDESNNSGVRKTKNIEKAYHFASVSDAIKVMKRCSKKTKGYYVFDTFKDNVLWKRMSREEWEQFQKNRLEMAQMSMSKNGKVKRKTYSEGVRKLIYKNASGRCELCGRKILYSDMTLDHINPLSMGGEDDVSNLAATCYPCNLFKGNNLPTDFHERITDIFMYQIEKKHSRSLKWKIVHSVLEKML